MHEWYKSTTLDSPFGNSYLDEFQLPPERTAKEIISVNKVLGAMKKSPRIIDIAGGFGRISSNLSNIVNLDLNINLLNRAKLSGITTACGDMRNLPFADKSFDLALLMFTSFGYFSSDDDNQGVLEEVSRVLTNEGRFVLDMPNYHRIVGNFIPNRTLTCGNGDQIQYSSKLSGKFLVEDRTLIQKSSGQVRQMEPIILRVYMPSEIAQMLKVNFNKVELYDQDLNEFAAGSSRRLWLISSK